MLGIEVSTALCVPLLRPDGKPCGVLLATNRAQSRRFAREDEATARNMGIALYRGDRSWERLGLALSGRPEASDVVFAVRDASSS